MGVTCGQWLGRTSALPGMIPAAMSTPQSTEPDPRLRLAYEESVRALSVQSRVLDELRSRTGVVLSAASVASAFLGAQAFTKEHHSIADWRLAAVIAYGAVIALAIGVLLPGSGWGFTQDAKALVDDYATADLPLDYMHESMAIEGAWARIANEAKMDRRFWAFRLACVALCASIVFWLLAIAHPG